MLGSVYFHMKSMLAASEYMQGSKNICTYKQK